jgi:predicted RND superfamily exporter protein
MLPPTSRTPGGTLRRSITALIRYRIWLLGVAVILGVAAAIIGQRLSLDRSIENMFAPDDPILVPYRRLQRTFGEHEVVLAMYADEKLSTPEGIDRVGKLADKLRRVSGVVAVVSLVDFEGTGRTAQFREVFAGYTHNEAMDAAGVMCLVDRPGVGEISRRETLAQMRAIITEYPRGALVGEPVLVEEAFDLLERDGRRLNTWCTLLVLLTIFVCFRNIRWLVLPLAVVQLTLALTNGLLVLSGMELSMVSSMLGAIVTVVGVASVVHIMVHYQDLRREGHDRTGALTAAFEELAAPITVAILTDAAGFAALMVSKVGPVHDFGLMMAVGSLLVLPACILLTPGVLWLTAPAHPAAIPDDRLRSSAWLARILIWAQRYVWHFTAIMTAITIVALIGTRRLTIETDFTKNFRSDSQIVRAYGFVEERFGGAGVWDLLIPVASEHQADVSGTKADLKFGPPSTSLLAEVLQLERRVEKSTPLLSKAISIADSFHAALGDFQKLGMFGRGLVRAAWGKMNADMPEFIDTLYNVDPTDNRQWLHVLLRSPEQLSAEEKSAMIEQVKTAATEQYPEAEVTGYYVLLNRLIESVLADQWKAFIVATVVVGLMIFIALRDWRLTAVTFMPNIFPSIILFGVMGWLGLRVNMGAAMIAAVSIGLSVDSSVHYTMFYQRQRRLGLTLDHALHRAQDSVGRAAVFSTLALTIGFGALVVSDFIPTIYFGVLVSLSMIGALIGNLLLLPVLIRMVEARADAQ